MRTFETTWLSLDMGQLTAILHTLNQLPWNGLWSCALLLQDIGWERRVRDENGHAVHYFWIQFQARPPVVNERWMYPAVDWEIVFPAALVTEV